MAKRTAADIDTINDTDPAELLDEIRRWGIEVKRLRDLFDKLTGDRKEVKVDLDSAEEKLFLLTGASEENRPLLDGTACEEE